MLHAALSTTLLLTWLFAIPGPAWARDGQAADTSHLRPASPAARQLIADAARQSPTVRRLMEEVDRSDVIAYVQLTGSPAIPIACTTFVTATNNLRYLRIQINGSLNSWARMQILGHELQHVLEIVGAPEVNSENALKALYDRIGTASARANRFETRAAQITESTVQREIAQHAQMARRIRGR